METAFEKSKSPLTFNFESVVKIVSATLVIAGMWFGLKATFAAQIADLDKRVTVQKTEQENLAASVASQAESMKYLNAKVDTLLIDRGYDPAKVISRLKP